MGIEMQAQETNTTVELEVSKHAYQAPAVKVLGSLAGLTQSGSTGSNEMSMGANPFMA
jgi:hypothetical protein